MPDDRIISSRHGHGDRTSLLTDLEFRVWEQYQHSADDFGVMRMTFLQIQSDNLALAKRPKQVIQRALEELVTVKLVKPFLHQRQVFVCQLDWQDFQKKTYTKRTQLPLPPADILVLMTKATQKLMATHPGGGKVTKSKKGFQESSENLSGIVLEDSENIFATRETLTLIPNARADADTHANPEERRDVQWEQFKAAYPASKRYASFLTEQVFVGECDRVGFAVILEGLERHKLAWTNPQYIPSIERFLTEKRWEAVPVPESADRKAGKHSQWLGLNKGAEINDI